MLVALMIDAVFSSGQRIMTSGLSGFDEVDGHWSVDPVRFAGARGFVLRRLCGKACSRQAQELQPMTREELPPTTSHAPDWSAGSRLMATHAYLRPAGSSPPPPDSVREDVLRRTLRQLRFRACFCRRRAATCRSLTLLRPRGLRCWQALTARLPPKPATDTGVIDELSPPPQF